MTAKRPDWVKPPDHLSKNPPVPDPAEPKPATEHGGGKGPERTRYGDWERNGICRDF